MIFKSNDQRRAVFANMFSKRAVSLRFMDKKGSGESKLIYEDSSGNKIFAKYMKGNEIWRVYGKNSEGEVLSDESLGKLMHRAGYSMSTERPGPGISVGVIKSKFSSEPDYSEETWQKEVLGVPKYKIDRYYRGVWGKLAPQLKDRNVLVRYAYDGEQVVKRHPHGKASYTVVDNVDDLSEIVHEHGVELWPETSKKGDLERGDMVVVDVDNLGNASPKDMKKITKGVYEKMGRAFGSPYIVNTANGYHVGVKLGKPVPYKTLRNAVDKEVIEPLEEEYKGLVSKKYDEAPIWLDKTPIKKHGSTKAVGSLNMPDLVITEKIDISELDGFRRDRLT